MILSYINHGSARPGHPEPVTPRTILVVLGVNNTVTWFNNDNTAHTLTPDRIYQGEEKFYN